MKKLFLRTLLASEELDVVDKQCVERSIRSLEFRNLVVLQATNHIPDKTLRVNVGNPGGGIPLQHRVADSVHQVRFAKPDATINK